jgi:hypothetical protein
MSVFAALLQVTKQQLPSSGILSVTFVASHRASWEAQPLSDTEFDSMWRCLVDPRRLAKTALALEQTLNISFGGSGLGPDPLGTAGDDRGLAYEGLAAAREPGNSSSSKSARGGGAAAPIVTGRSWYDVGGSMAGSIAGAGGGGGSNHVHAVTDGWKMQLLQVRLLFTLVVLMCCIVYIISRTVVCLDHIVLALLQLVWHTLGETHCNCQRCSPCPCVLCFSQLRKHEKQKLGCACLQLFGYVLHPLAACLSVPAARCWSGTATSPPARLLSWWQPSHTGRQGGRGSQGVRREQSIRV